MGIEKRISLSMPLMRLQAEILEEAVGLSRVKRRKVVHAVEDDRVLSY
jgi:hypothetical protein